MEVSSLPRGTKIKKGLALQGLFFRLQKSHPAPVGAAEGCDLLILLLFHAAHTGGAFHKDGGFEPDSAG
jgi:hypothetical protein